MREHHVRHQDPYYISPPDHHVRFALPLFSGFCLLLFLRFAAAQCYRGKRVIDQAMQEHTHANRQNKGLETKGCDYWFIIP